MDVPNDRRSPRPEMKNGGDGAGETGGTTKRLCDPYESGSSVVSSSREPGLGRNVSVV